MKIISMIILICFIFTGVPIRSYAALSYADKLSAPVADRKHPGKAEEISQELILSDQRPVWKKDLKDAKKARQIEVHQFAKEVLKALPPESTILSLGSGSGLDEIFFAKAGHTVVATDFVESAIKELNEKISEENIKNLTTKLQDLTKTFDFPDESFDVVYSHLSLNFMPDAEIAKAIKEIYRVLKPGGRLYLIAQSVNDKTRGEGKEIEKDTIVRDGKLIHYFSKEYIKERFADFEFKDEDITTGERVFYPPEGRVIGFIQLKAKKPGIDFTKPTFKGNSLKELLTIIPKDFTPEYVFFDIEGTLINTEGLAKLYIKAAQKHGVTISTEYIRKYIGGAVRLLNAKEAMEIFSQFGTDEETVRLITKDFRQTLEDAANTDYFKDFLYEDVKEVFAYFKKRGIKIGIVTNRYEQLALKHMESLGLLEYLAQDSTFKRTKGYVVLGGDSAELFQKEGLISTLKGKSALLDLSKKIFNIKSPNTCLMVGDMEADIKAARLNNMPSFLVNRESAVSKRKEPLPTIFEQLEKIYEEKGANMDDYYVPPLVVVDPKGEPVAKVKKGDVVIFANHRSDRAREALYALTDPDFNKKGNRFDTENLGVTFVPFNVYDKEYFKAHGIQAAFTSESTLPPYQSIIEVLQQAGVVQGYFTESDKGQHVTHFFAGQRDLDYASLGIEVSVISSEGVKDEKKDPQMKYKEITDNVINYLNEIKGIRKKKIIVVNLPVDIQGHNIKGNKERAIKTVLAADEAAGRIRKAILSQNGVYIETSDHGNIEKLATLDDNGIPISDKYGVIPFDEHTTNPVNFIIDGLGKDIKLKKGKGLSNIAATLLEILGIPKSKEMNESLLSDYKYQEIEGPIILVIRDGWGVNPFENQEAKEYNGIELAQPPVFLDLLKNCPHTTLKAHGDAVGLPDYQMGDSDNGHRVIGTGFNPPTLYKQIIDQIEKGAFFQNPVLLQAFETAKKEKSDVHIMGLYSSGGIHSDNRFFLALMEMAKKVNFSGKVNLWPFLDGRDVMTRIPTENGIFYLKQIQDKISELNLPNIQLAGTIGRNFAMDRDGINVDIAADKKEKLAGTKTGGEADKLKKEAAKSREENKKIWEERFKLAYRLLVNGEGIPVKIGFESGEKKTNVQAEVDNIISSSNGKIKVGLFDIGGVLFNNARSDVINNFQKAIKNKFGKEIAGDEVEKLIFTGESAQKLRVDLPIEDFVDGLNNHLQAKFNRGDKFGLDEFMDLLFLNYEPPTGMVDLVRNLKDRGLGIYVISNNFISNRFNVKEMTRDRLNAYYSRPGEKEIFNDENLIMSNEIGFTKPNTMAFNKALEKINSELKSNLNPENVLFLNDQWENVNSAKQLGYRVVGINEEVSGLLNFLDANSRFFKAVGGETAFREYLENILLLYQTLKPERFLSGSKLTLIVHSSFFRIGGAVDALNEIIKMKSGDGKSFVKIGIYGEGAAKLKSLLGDSSDVVTADSAEKLIQELKKENIDYQEEIVVLRPIGEKIDTDVKQIGFSEKTISTIAVAKAMQALTGMDVSGKYKNEAISYAFKEFYRQERDKGIISDEVYENTKDRLSLTLDLPDIELAPGINDITKNDAEVISKFIDSFI